MPESSRFAVGFQGWRDVLFVHWPMPAALIRRAVPAGLELDLHEGEAWVSLLPFRAIHGRPLGVPRALGVDFLEVNLRTYVRLRGQAGIWFFSLDASSRLAVFGARALLGLPYVHARIEARAERDSVGYRCERGTGARLELRASPLGPPSVAPPDSLASFLLERYNLFVQRRNALWQLSVRHAPWMHADARVDAFEENMLAAAGLPTVGRQPLFHASPGVDVTFYAPARVLVGRAASDLDARTPG